MANASVEKLKALGLRQGEKFVVGIAATVLVVCLALFATKPTIATTPAELQKKAEQADSNLNRKQEPDAILARIEEAGIKDPGFVKIVENQSANALKPGDYRARLDWVTPEPGAGLIRDQPEVIAPTELVAFPGRGGALLYKLDEKGERIVDKSGAGSGAGRRGGRPGGGGMMTDAGPGGGPPSENQRKRQEQEDQRKKRLLAGNVETPKKDEAEKKADAATPDPAANGPWVEETVGKRWVVVTGVIDNAQMNKNWLEALKNPAIAYPQYHRVDAERQTRTSDGDWSEWKALNDEDKYNVIDNMPEGDEEFLPALMRPEAIVDPLPFLRAGYWTGVHVARLVPADAMKAPNAMPAGGASFRAGGMGSPANEMGRRGGGGTSVMGEMGGSRMGGQRGEGGGMGEGGGGAVEEAVTANTEATLMLRSLDFTVEPNMSYRYRVRLVVKNPNFERTDVNPGVETVKQFLVGPWSEPTSDVTVPADVSTYAQIPAPDARRDDVVTFQVVRWNPATGQTVVKLDDAGPGFLIGDNGSVLEPSSEGGGAKSATIDFNSRSFVLDAIGGKSRIPDIGVERNTFVVPAVAMVVEPDGSVVIRNQASDRSDEVRQDMEANYDQAIKDSGKKRERGNGSRQPRGASGSGGRRPGGGRRR